MALVLKNRVKSTTTTTGTGTITLGAAAAGHQDFSTIGAEIPGAWNLTFASYSNISRSISAQEAGALALSFKPDGTKMYVMGTSGDDVNEYSLSTPWLVSSASYIQNFSVAAQDTTPSGLFFKPDGTKMYITGNDGDDVNEYDLATAWDVSTASYVQNFSVSAQDISPQGIFFKTDGLKMYVVGSAGDDVNEYSLSSAWDISSASYVQNFSVATNSNSPTGLSFSPDGTKMCVLGDAPLVGQSVAEYVLSTPWNISTAAHFYNFSVNSQDSSAAGLFFKPSGLGFYVVGPVNDRVYQYTISASENQTYYSIIGETEWEVGIGSVAYDGSYLTRDTVFGSSSSGAKVDFAAGTKDVLCAYPAAAMPLGVPYCDDSEIGTDLSGWTAFQAALNAGVAGGTTFGNNNTNGVISTYGLLYTSPGATLFFGGVLAPNGDIHFVPYSAVRGQKINYLTGAVSTYSLVYTTATAYAGGVLASNGDIHFVPSQAIRGQKINSSGVVSTYSLVYTAGSYEGGVLAPNGDIHFVPYSANRGQKISAAGVVSTYSLIYTASGAYSGGVLAANGDIHFVPNSANVGQKISAAGVVSTYSLVYTTTDAYNGGVLAPNGDIHFIRYSSANRGQKVSISGVVSTYSLVSTAAGNKYRGGVLAPNGDIHFVPQSADLGQKISATGVVSTYSIIRQPGLSNAGDFCGGILCPDGTVYFIPQANFEFGEKISTNPGQPLGPGVCLSSFLNKF